MSRKKINFLIIVGILILYIVSMDMSFNESIGAQAQLFAQVTGWAENNFYHNDSKDLSPQEYADSFVNDNLRGSGYPFVLRLYDKEGNIVARSGSYITIENFPSPYNDEEILKKVNIEKYLTEDIKVQIANYSKNLKSFPVVYEFSYLEKDGEIIPVDITIGASDKEIDGDEQMSFHLTDEKSEKTIKSTNIHEMQIYIYGMVDNKVDTKIYDKLNVDKLTSEESNYIERLKEDDVTECGGGSSSAEFLECRKIIKIGDENYAAIFKVMHNLKYDTLKIRFSGIGISISIIFFLAGLILLISINRMITKNERLNSAKDAFTSAAAHELKTPISIIQNQCECIMENIAPEKNMEYVESIYDESNRMNKLVLDLLQYNRVAMATKIQKKSISLSETVSEELEKYSPVIEAKGVKLYTQIKPDIKINANKDMIALVIDNYLSNAIKYGDGKKIIIILENERFSVFNTGNIINVKNKNEIWDVFYRSDSSRTRQGSNSSGLGLATCKQVLKLHKYKYGYINKVNGVEFYFDF